MKVRFIALNSFFFIEGFEYSALRVVLVISAKPKQKINFKIYVFFQYLFKYNVQMLFADFFDCVIMNDITSLKDEKIQLAKTLNSFKGRIQNKKILIEGEEAIDWAINSDIDIDYILVSKQLQDVSTKYTGTDVYSASDGLLKKVTDTNYLIPILAVGNLPDKPSKSDFIVVLDDVKDFGNIGTIVRTCHAFGIDTILNTKSDIDLFQRKTVDSSRGRVFGTNYISFSNPNEAISYLKKNNYQIVTTSPYGNKIQSLISLSEQPVALIVGNETEGVSNEFIEHSDITVQIPMQNEVESLNVGVATGISIYELKLKKVIGMIEKKIKSTLGRELNVASFLVREVLDKELKKVSELSSVQLVFMMVLKCDTFMSIIDVQKQFGIPDSEIDSFFSLLITKGYIRKDISNNIFITENGIETIGKLWTIIENTENMILSDFTETEKNELKYLIAKLQNKCIEIINL